MNEALEVGVVEMLLPGRIRGLSLGVLGLVLTGCFAASVAPGTKFNVESTKGLVLVKTVSGDQTRTIHIGKFDPTSQTLIPNRGTAFRHPDGYQFSGGNLGVAAAGEPLSRYHLFSLEPGDYVFSTIEFRSAAAWRFYKLPQDTVTFEVRPGEVLILGEIDIEAFALGSYEAMFSAGIDPDEASSVLAAFGEIGAPVRQYILRTTDIVDF